MPEPRFVPYDFRRLPTHAEPDGLLSGILKRPKNEAPYILFPVGYAAKNCTVPDIRRKPLEEVSIWM